MRIVTNNQPRFMVYGFELTEKEREEFNYLENVDDGTFLRYRGHVYDLGEFMRCEGETMKGWDGYTSESYFSGVLVKVLPSSEAVIIGSYFL